MAISHYDEYLRIMKSPDEYHWDKVKAGAMGGMVSKPNRLACKRNAKGASYHRLKNPVERTFLCIHDIDRYQQGRTYKITVGGPIPFGLKSWSEFLTYFSERKVLK
jgi:hypothetical protein